MVSTVGTRWVCTKSGVQQPILLARIDFSIRLLRSLTTNYSSILRTEANIQATPRETSSLRRTNITKGPYSHFTTSSTPASTTNFAPSTSLRLLRSHPDAARPAPTGPGIKTSLLSVYVYSPDSFSVMAL